MMTNIRLTETEKSYFVAKEVYSISVELEGDWKEIRKVQVQPTDYLNPEKLPFQRWIKHLKQEKL